MHVECFVKKGCKDEARGPCSLIKLNHWAIHREANASEHKTGGEPFFTSNVVA